MDVFRSDSVFYLYSIPGEVLFFFFNDTATTEIYTLSLHDALPISELGVVARELVEHFPDVLPLELERVLPSDERTEGRGDRSEEHTSELQSQSNLVCRLLLEKKNSNH